ncbi:MAG: prolipoprotein diacylglyceryl transferase [Candidatus Thiodiazotropha sp. 'RUGA']|nr:prolipoprotein diacylglyceryl transferase [Candidatus Thiodiazotropha sp. 'RUGA']
MEQQALDFIVWNVDPTLIAFAGLEIRWYGALFALAYLLGYQTIYWIYQNDGRDAAHLERLSIYLVIATIAGARLGHCLFYDPAYFLANPWKIPAFWEGGLASHGGGLGVILALYIHKRQSGETFLWLLDRFAIPTALVGMLIRLGNLFNSEIYGNPTNLPWAFIFERIDQIPRHPAQLYEAIGYGLIFVVLMLFYRRMRLKIEDGLIFGMFLIGVFTTRFLVEFVKSKQAAYTTDVWLSTGQLLSLPFIAAGIVLILLALRKSGDKKERQAD